MLFQVLFRQVFQITFGEGNFGIEDQFRSLRFFDQRDGMLSGFAAREVTNFAVDLDLVFQVLFLETGEENEPKSKHVLLKEQNLKFNIVGAQCVKLICDLISQHSEYTVCSAQIKTPLQFMRQLNGAGLCTFETKGI